MQWGVHVDVRLIFGENRKFRRLFRCNQVWPWYSGPGCTLDFGVAFFQIDSINNLLGYALVRPFLYFDHFHIFDFFCTSTALLRPLYFVRFASQSRSFHSLTSTFVLRPLYFDLLSNLDLLLVEKHRSKYSFGQSTEIEVKFWST